MLTLKKILNRLNITERYRIGIFSENSVYTICTQRYSLGKCRGAPIFHSFDEVDQTKVFKRLSEWLHGQNIELSSSAINYCSKIPFQFKEVSCDSEIFDFEEDLADFLAEEGIPQGTDPGDFIVRHTKISETRIALGTIKRKARLIWLDYIDRFDALGLWRKTLVETEGIRTKQLSTPELLRLESEIFRDSTSPCDKITNRSYAEVAAYGLSLPQLKGDEFNFISSKILSLLPVKRIASEIVNLSKLIPIVTIPMLLICVGIYLNQGYQYDDISEKLNQSDYGDYQNLKTRYESKTQTLTELSKLGLKHRNIGPGLIELIDELPGNVWLKNVNIVGNNFELQGYSATEMGAVSYVKQIENMHQKQYDIAAFHSNILAPQRGNSANSISSIGKYEFFINIIEN